MNPTQAMKAMRKAYDFFGHYKTLEDTKKATDFSKELLSQDPQKFTREKVRLFKNKEMTTIIDRLTKAVKVARDLKKLKMQWPPFDIDREITEIAKVARKTSIEDKKVKARITALNDKINDLHMTYVLIELACVQGAKRYNEKAAEAKRTADYLHVLYDAFRKVAMVPQGYSTAPQAAFIELSQDAVQAKGLANTLKGLLKDVAGNYDTWKGIAGPHVKTLHDWSEMAGVEGLKVAVEAEL